MEAAAGFLRCSDYKNLLATVTRRLTSWSPSDAGYSHLLGMQAYGMQAAGRLDAAEALAEKALSMSGNDRWACKWVNVAKPLRVSC